MKEINPDAVAPPFSRYSHATVSSDGRFVFVSGAIGVAPDGSLPGDFEGQMRQLWPNLQTILEEAGSGLERILRMNGFLKNREDAGAFRTIREEVLSHRPASTVVIAELIDPAWLIEVEVIAEV